MAYSPMHISNNLLRRGFEAKVNVSPMKLQKLLYFTASEYAKFAKAPLLEEQFQAWPYGPVIPSVYREFKPFGGAPIRAYGKDVKGKAYAAQESIDESLRTALDRVWAAGMGRSAAELSRITHLPGSAWSRAYQDGGVISNEAVAEDTTYQPNLGLTYAPNLGLTYRAGLSSE